VIDMKQFVLVRDINIRARTVPYNKSMSKSSGQITR